jgi:putative alpha-1,2-mannosidase
LVHRADGEEMGKDSLADVFYERSRNWQNLFDPETKFFRPRRNGGFIEPFDPYEVNLPLHRGECVAVQHVRAA